MAWLCDLILDSERTDVVDKGKVLLACVVDELLD